MPSTAIALPPPLREGDRLNSTEFLRRWDAMPDLRHAELIDGVVLMPSPVGKEHGRAHYRVNVWLGLYEERTLGCEGGSESTWLMTDESVPQPDLTLRIAPAYGGQSKDSGNFLAGAPELIVEVTGSTTSRDLGIKLELYRKVGVREYLTILLNPKQVVWRRLVRSRYQEIEPAKDGFLHSHVFPGLWLDPAALFDSNKSLLTALEGGLQSPEHAAFVEKLRKAARP